ncbi:hypothetical protein PM082_023579 [Marasmius tenuissimus]|nr:hypothetical protein PM082_023579 [Marasmius tenuissimus]
MMHTQYTQPLKSLIRAESISQLSIISLDSDDFDEKSGSLVSPPPTSPLYELNEFHLELPLQKARKVSLADRWIVPVLIYVGRTTERTIRRPSGESIDTYSFPPLPSPPPTRSRLTSARSSIIGKSDSGDEGPKIAVSKKRRVKRRPASMDLTKPLFPRPVLITNFSYTSSSSSSSSCTLVNEGGHGDEVKDVMKEVNDALEPQLSPSPGEPEEGQQFSSLSHWSSTPPAVSTDPAYHDKDRTRNGYKPNLGPWQNRTLSTSRSLQNLFSQWSSTSKLESGHTPSAPLPTPRP